jgi:hypothetical protein
MLNEWWTVYGSFYGGPKKFQTLAEAEVKYEKTCNDRWSSRASIVHSVRIKENDK